MGKRKAAAECEGSARKKHKKNKHKKKGKNRDEEGSRVVEAEPGVRPLTLKIKLGKKPVESDKEEEEEEVSSVGDSGTAPAEAESIWPTGEPSFTEDAAGEEGSEGDEEAWLVAMEKGQLDDTGYIPRRPGTALTARQRAMLGSTDEQLLELPLGKASKEMTEEMILKKTEKNRKRRQAAQRRKEKRKAETVRKLLEKQTKKKDETKPTSEKTGAVAYLHYVSSHHSSSLSVGPGTDCPLAPQPKREPPVLRLCAVSGCHGSRRYCDSSSGLPLCSLRCYRTLHPNTS